MKKTILIILSIFFSCKVYSQAPKIKYTVPANIVVGKAITPIKPANTGGAVPRLLFSEVSTIAGSGSFGQHDDVVSKATFNYAVNAVQDSKGNIYVADAGSHAVRKISVKGIVTTFAGSVKGVRGSKVAKDTAARFNFPTGIAVDKNDNVYLADISNNVIRKITPGGNVSTFAGSGSYGSSNGNGANASFILPYGICVDAYGNLLVADTYGNKIRRITLTGDVTTIAGASGVAGFSDGHTSVATFTAPRGIAADKLGNIYVTESDSLADKSGIHNRVRKIDTNTGMVTTFAQVPLQGPVGITVDARNYVYVSSLYKYNIYRFAPNGTRSDPFGAFSGGTRYDIANGIDTLTKYRGNMGLTYNGIDHVIIADAFAGLIRKTAVNGYQIYPRLPDGLGLDSTGTITGTPTKVFAEKKFTIYAYNNSGVDSVSIMLGVGQGTQTITFPSITARSYGDADFSPRATSANTTIPIVYSSSDVSVASIVNNNIRINKNGTAAITATQAGNANYKAATPVTRTLVVKEGITLNYPATNTFTVNERIATITPSNVSATIPKFIYSSATTVAGDGTYGGKDDEALKATFRYPLSSAVDASGNIYVADAGSNAIRKISTDGKVTTFAGSATGASGAVNGKGTAARFRYPAGIAVDALGNVYVADQTNNMIRKITPDGDVSTLAGNVNSGSADGKGASARFTQPYGLAIDKLGNLLVADTYNNKIRKITSDGTVTTIVGTGAQGNANGAALTATLNRPKSVAVDNSGNIYITEEGNNAVRKVTAVDNTVSNFTSGGQFAKPVGIAVDGESNVYVSSADSYTIRKLRPNGKVEDSTLPFSGGKFRGNINSTDTLTRYNGSMGLFYDGKNHIIVSDPASFLIRKVAVNGYKVNPRLPAGLKLDSIGRISGTPSAISSLKSYTITAFNNNGYGTSVTKIGVEIGSQTITFNSLPAQTYGAADFSPAAKSTNSTISIIYTSSDKKVATIVDGNIHIVGAGAATIKATQAGNKNYTAATSVSKTLQVNKAPLLITAEDKIKTVNNENPELTITFAGFVNGENSSELQTLPVAQTNVLTSTAAGKYPINVSVATAENYDITYKNGELTVFPVPEVIATGSTTIVKGGFVLLSAVPGSNYTYQWYLNGSVINGATASSYPATQTGGYNVSITDNGYTTYSLVVAVIAQLQLPADNFTLKANSTSCKGTNDGSMTVTVKTIRNYTAIVTGNGNTALYTFTDQLKLSNLPPGNFSICFSVEGEIFNQCFQVNITEPQDLSLYSVVNKAQSTLTLQLAGGSLYNIRMNNVDYTTSSSQITIPLSAGINKLSVTTDKLCQGVVEKEIDMGTVLPFPNPFITSVKVNVGNRTVGNAKVNVIDVRNGKTVYQNKYSNTTGILEIDLSTLESGIYYLNLNLDSQESGYKIIKK